MSKLLMVALLGMSSGLLQAEDISTLETASGAYINLNEGVLY